MLYFGDYNRTELYVKHINCKTSPKGDQGHWTDVGHIEALKQKMTASTCYEDTIYALTLYKQFVELVG